MSIRALAPVGRPVALGEQVYSALRALLRSGDLDAGQPLQEVALASQLGVSRTPVREALARLASEGLLAVDGRSFTVPALTRTDVEDIYELRCLIEPAAMRCAAPRAADPADPAARTALDAALADAASAHRRADSDAFRAAHVAHRAAWLALVPNQRMVRMIELYAEHLQHIRALTLDDADVRTIVLRGLEHITAALVAGDGEAAAQATHAHLRQARLAFLKALGLETDEAPEPPFAHTPTPPSRGGTRADAPPARRARAPQEAVR